MHDSAKQHERALTQSCHSRSGTAQALSHAKEPTSRADKCATLPGPHYVYATYPSPTAT